MSIQAMITDCENHLRIMREDISVNEKYLKSLYVKLQEQTPQLSQISDAFDNETTDDTINLAYLEAARQKELEELTLKPSKKVVWLLDKDTYRVAIVSENGVVQVKVVENGQFYESENTFASEEEWRKSLPRKGHFDTTYLYEDFVKTSPLIARTDPLKLKELESRFPGGVFILDKGIEIEYFYHTILCRKDEFTALTFKDFGTDKPNLVVQWKGLTIPLSHLF